MFVRQTKHQQSNSDELYQYESENAWSLISSIRFDKNDVKTFEDYIQGFDISSCIISSTSVIPEWLPNLLKAHRINDIHIFDSTTPLPITNRYHTPSTLGTDRLASVIGGYYISGKKNPVLCIDCGTAITYDFINSRGEYLGGNISPGLDLRFRSLHDYTGRLPLVNINGQTPELGDSTHTAIRSGVKIGIINEINGYIDKYQEKFPNIYIYFTGGNSLDFEYPSKKRIFAERNLVLIGLNIILAYIKSKQ